MNIFSGRREASFFSGKFMNFVWPIDGREVSDVELAKRGFVRSLITEEAVKMGFNMDGHLPIMLDFYQRIDLTKINI